jgi:phospholipid/cholesterol/gamma-HCH transport system permease protein
MGCYHGFRAKGGAEGVGQATTRAVVSSMVLVLIFDYIIARLVFR